MCSRSPTRTPPARPRALSTFRRTSRVFGRAAGVEQNIGTQIANLSQTGGLAGADVFGRAAGIEQNIGAQIADLSQSEGFAQSDIGAKAAIIEQQSGVNLANLAQQTDLNKSQTL